MIIFATGFVGVDQVIRDLIEEHFSGYENGEVISGKYWEFKPVDDEFSNIECFRIAHPRATHGHREFREKVIQSIKARAAG